MMPRIVCLGALYVELRHRVEDLAPFLAAWPDLSPGGELALPPGEEGRLLELLGRHGRPRGRSRGGPAANTAYALARMGLKTALFGRVGQDANGAFLKDSLTGVNLAYLTTAGVSGRTYILSDPEGRRTVLAISHTNDELRLGDLPLDFLAQADFLHFTPFPGAGPLAVQMQLAHLLGNGPRLTLDPGKLYARRGWEALEELIDHLDTLIVTEREWELLGGQPMSHPLWAPPVVVIKRGARGARLLTPPRYLDFPVELVSRPVDTSPAGDVFAAGYLAGRLSGLHLNLAVRLGNRAAVVSLFGDGQDDYPGPDFLEEQLDQLRQI